MSNALAGDEQRGLLPRRVRGEHVRDGFGDRLPVGMCRNSFGPCAFELGPSTPVTTNCASGNFAPEHAHERDRAALAHHRHRLGPNAARDASSSAASSHGAVFGAFQPEPGSSPWNDTRAP